MTEWVQHSASCVSHGTKYFFFIDPATTETSPLSLPDALPFSAAPPGHSTLEVMCLAPHGTYWPGGDGYRQDPEYAARKERDRKSTRLNSSPRQYLVCRLLLEKKTYSWPWASTVWVISWCRVDR